VVIGARLYQKQVAPLQAVRRAFDKILGIPLQKIENFILVVHVAMKLLYLFRRLSFFIDEIHTLFLFSVVPRRYYNKKIYGFFHYNSNLPKMQGFMLFLLLTFRLSSAKIEEKTLYVLHKGKRGGFL
jgi:hypothetical protein